MPSTLAAGLTHHGASHRLQLHLLIGRQLILNPDRHAHVQRFDLAFGIKNLAELRQRLLLVDLIRLHCFVQGFHRII